MYPRQKAVSDMKKPGPRSRKFIILAPIVLLAPVIILIIVWMLLLGSLYIHNQIQRNQIRHEIFRYVQSNSHEIKLENPDKYQEFFYTATGLQDGGVEYGYYFSPNNEHTLQGDPYRKGYRIYGIPDDHSDWYYSERICRNWFYYEIHDG